MKMTPMDCSRLLRTYCSSLLLPGLLVAATTQLVPESLAESSGWPMFRHDRLVTGHSPGHGNLRQPPTKDTRFDLGRPAPAHVQARDLGRDGISELIYSTAAGVVVSSATEQELWKAPNERILAVDDFDGNGVCDVLFDGPVVVEGTTGRRLWSVSHEGTSASRTFIGKMIPGSPGFQLVIVNGWKYTNTAWVYDFSNGYESPELLWTRQINESKIYDHGSCAIGFLEEYKGTPVIVAAMKGRVIVIDLRTGEELSRAEWLANGEVTHRNYGIVHIEDIDDDGWMDVVLTNSSISQQLARLSWGEQTGVTFKWNRWFDWWYPQGDNTLRVSANCVCDLNGDGRFEVVSSIHKDDWTLEITDTVSGKVLDATDGLVLQEVVTLGDARPPLIVCSREPGRVSREVTDVVILRYADSSLTALIELPGHTFPGEIHHSFPVGKGGRSAYSLVPLLQDDDGDGTREIAVLAANPDRSGFAAIELIGFSADGNLGLKRSIEIDPAGIAALHAWENVDRDPSPEFVFSTTTGAIVILSSTGELKATWPAENTYTAFPIAADVTGDGENEIIVPTARGTVQALNFHVDDAPSVVWEAPGHGVPAYYGRANTVLAENLVGNQAKETIVARPAASGMASVAVLGTSGDSVWQTELPEITWTLDYPAVGRITVGRFTGKETCDVYCAGRRAPTGNDASSSFVLDGRTGEVVWANHGADSRLSFHTIGPMALPAVADRNGDGCDDIFLNALHMLTCLDGTSGEMLLEPKLFNEWLEEEATWTAYGSFIPFDLNLDDTPELLSVANFGCFGAFTWDSKPIWFVDPVDPDRHVRTHPGIVDVDADGKLEFGTPMGGEFYCYDAATGELEWEIPLPDGIGTDVSAADIDGDGLPEFLLGCGSSLLAVEDRSGDGKILWSKPFSGTVSAPVLADVRGDESLEILVVTTDGILHVLE